MRSLWIKVVLLTLACIAIQFTAIYNLSPMLHRYSCGCPGSETLVEPNDKVQVHNSSSKVHVLLLTTARSGSTFFGQLFNHHQDVFYLYEPLHHVQETLIRNNRLSLNWQHMAGASRDLLRSLFSCDLYAFENYIQPPPVNHLTDHLKICSYSQALCQHPICDAFGANVIVNYWDCLIKCPLLNLTLVAQSCHAKQHVVLKIIRVPELGDLRALVEDPRLNVKVIQLVRDPRGILNSRIQTFSHIYHPWKEWQKKGTRPDDLDEAQLTNFCDDCYSSVLTGLSRPNWLKGKYLLVRYEDLAKNPLKNIQDIYHFVGLTLTKSIEEWIHANTQGTKEVKKHPYSTKRDSAANAQSWRQELSYDIVKFVQRKCQKFLLLLGYKSVRSEEELKNMTNSLVEDKTFVPF